MQNPRELSHSRLFRPGGEGTVSCFHLTSEGKALPSAEKHLQTFDCPCFPYLLGTMWRCVEEHRPAAHLFNEEGYNDATYMPMGSPGFLTIGWWYACFASICKHMEFPYSLTGALLLPWPTALVLLQMQGTPRVRNIRSTQVL